MNNITLKSFIASFHLKLEFEGEEGRRVKWSKWRQFNEAARFRDVSFELGMEFINLDVFKQTVNDYSDNDCVTWVFFERVLRGQLLSAGGQMTRLGIIWQRVPPKQWIESACETSNKSQVVANIMCEQFNEKILVVREKPIITMLEEIRIYIIKKIIQQRNSLQRFKGPNLGA
ncbi:hypothetical protein L6164_016862 [Bauhinia variegata]|uniref:Uncharacterized protein n=1 Tax=Bauhinia variegata TaxID=167791 RepID=A0ACB9N7D5_BAUVA|nr:hypothetical protein L6164_016862 [Bauhinia variegata]